MKSHPIANSFVAVLEVMRPSGRAVSCRAAADIRARRRVGAEGHQICEGLLGFGRGVNDRGLVAAQDAEPMANIAGVAVMEDIGESELRAASARTELGDEFLRSEARRVGKECVITCRSRCSSYH